MEINCPMADMNDQEMSSQPDLCTPLQQGLCQEEQEAHDLEPRGYTLISWRQLISTGEAARAKRAKYKSDRQQKQEKRNAFHDRNNKERIIQQKSIEIQELCVKIAGMKERHRAEMEVLVQQKEMSEMLSRERIKELREEKEEMKQDMEELKEEKEEMRREHTAELESRDQMQAILLVDLRELCQVYDEEVEMLRRTIDRQGKFLYPFFFHQTLLTVSQLFHQTTPPSTIHPPSPPSKTQVQQPPTSLSQHPSPPSANVLPLHPLTPTLWSA
jgi:DNA repair exonuclease SbcCD ATPase subunit